MYLWEIIACCGIAFIVLEIFFPALFFLNLAVAAFITAVVSLFSSSIVLLSVAFFIFSLISFGFLRPILVKRYSKESTTGTEDKYFGKKAKVIEDVSQTGGAISIYDERWTARTEYETVIPAGEEVEIVRNDNLVMYVKKV